MPLPQVGGSQTLHHGGSTTATFDISGIPNGAWMIMSAMCGTTSNSVTSPVGWTVIANGTTTGSRLSYLFVKNKEASDGSTLSITQSSTDTMSYALLWGTDGAPVANWIIGSQWVRQLNSPDPSGSRNRNIAPSVTTIEDDFLAIAISTEATNAYTAGTEIASIPSGWEQQLSLSQTALNVRIETIWMGTKELTAAGDSGDASITYTNTQDNNGWAMQVAIPSAEVAIPDSPQVIGTPTEYRGESTTGFTIDRPASATSGDYVVVALRGQSSTATVAPSSPGFTQLGPAFETSNVAHRMNGFYGRPVADISVEPPTYTFSFTSGAPNTRVVATAFVVRGVDIAAPLAGYYDSYGGRGVTGGKEVLEYTLNSSPALALFMGGSEFASPNDHTPTVLPTGYSPVSEVVTTTDLGVSRTYLWIGAREVTINVDLASIYWGTPASSAAQGISLKGTNSVAPDPTGSGFVARNGNGDPVLMYHMTAEGARTPADVVPMRRGFSSVAEMLATPGVTWAHRGGSASYPEMSLHGYTQSVARGYGVLEISMARTSDGVWFGLHDQTTDRTSGGTYGNASSQTWAQIQTQQNTYGPGDPQPYLRWEELVEKYGSSHIIMADLKHAIAGYRTEFLTMVYNDLGPTRAIIKFSGSGSGSAALAIDAQALGFETWGYFYPADASSALGGNGNMQTWAHNWTLLGMEYNASQAVWDEALAFGKPVYGHIIPNQAAYNTAMAKGASGAQVSGVAVVDPVSWWTQ